MDFNHKLEFSIRTKIALSKINKQRNSNYTFLKPKQYQCVQKVIKNDALIVLPTGYGKSLIYEIIQYMTQSKIIIISPINAIINEQLERFGRRAVKVDKKLIGDIEKHGPACHEAASNDVCFIVGHPEELTSKAACDTFISNPKWKNVSHIFVDEAHCLISWGTDFRPAFKDVSKLRSLFPSAVMVGMTATATLKMQSEIKQSLMMADAPTLSSNPNRDNIKIRVLRRHATVGGKVPVDEVTCDLLRPYVEELFQSKFSFPKTIIYTNLKICGLGYDFVKKEASKSNDNEMLKFVSQYHSPSTEEKKKSVSMDLRREDGNIRLLFATEAYGMGTDAPDVRRIVHIGPPNTLESYVQEIGRAGRDGERSEALLLFNASDIGSNRSHLHEDMKQFCLSVACRRNYLSEHFGFQKSIEMHMHDCCDICEKACDCDKCIDTLISNVKFAGKKEDSCLEVSANENLKNENVKYALLSYIYMENSECGMLQTGLSEDVVNKICKSDMDCSSEDVLRHAFPYLKEEHISCMYFIIWNTPSQS